MRFEVSRVLDTIEQHLTTDPLLAQAVFDLGEIARYPELDGGRGINLIRAGMVVDALGRYLRDGGVYLYPVAARKLLSDPELTSKERMVLGRWTDDGLIETTADAAERVFEIADLTGLPVVSLRTHPELAKPYGFLADAPLRVLTVTPRGGGALLTDGGGGTGGVLLRRRDEEEPPPRPSFWRRLAIGKATPISKIAPPKPEPDPETETASKAEPAPEPSVEPAVGSAPTGAREPVEAAAAAETVAAGPEGAEPEGAGRDGAERDGAGPNGAALERAEEPASGADSASGARPATEAEPATEPSSGVRPATEAEPSSGVRPATEAEPEATTGAGPAAEAGEPGAEDVAARPEPAAPAGMPRPPDLSIWPDPSRVYVTLLPEPPAIRAAPSGVGGALLARLWECGGFDCPGFGPGRRGGQPVPHMRKGVPYCPRHDERLKDAGARPAEIAVSLLVDGLRRRRFVVHETRPLVVGREPAHDDDIAVGAWLHEAAAAWISPEHLRLSVDGGQLVATDLSPNGSLVWMRTEPQARPRTRRLVHGETYTLGEWDTVELYTGIELGHGERRPQGVDASADEPVSVLIDAPTVAMLRLPERR